MTTEITVWVLSTCIPEEARPCYPQVFATEAEAEASADRNMRDEWAAAAPSDDEENALTYPGDWREAQDILAGLNSRWGTYARPATHTKSVRCIGVKRECVLVGARRFSWLRTITGASDGASTKRIADAQSQ